MSTLLDGGPYCRDPEGWRITSDLRDFDFALCFEEGVLLSSVLSIFTVTAVSRTWYLSRLPLRDISPRSSIALLAKQVLAGLSLVASITNLVLILAQKKPVAIFWPHILEPLALLFVLVLTRLNHRRTRASSTPLLVFWPCYCLELIVWTRSYTSGAPSADLVVVGLKWSSLLLGLLAFTLEVFSPDDSPDVTDEHPIIRANVYSKWTFSWLTPLLEKGVNVPVNEGDLPSLPPCEKSEYLSNKLQRTLRKYPSLWTALFVTYGGPYSFGACLKVFQDTLSFVQPQLLRWLLSFISNYQAAKSTNPHQGPSAFQGFGVSLTMFVVCMAQTVILQQYYRICFETGMRIRAGLVANIYKKALTIPSDERDHASGDVVNLISVDASRLQDFCTYGIIIISGPYQVTLALLSLYKLLGWSAFVGVGVMIISIPLNTTVGRSLKKMQEIQMENRDRRTRLMSELLANIRSIKLYAWEYAFMRRISHARNDLEMEMLRKIGITTALNNTLWSSIPLVVAFASFATASVFADKPLTADVIFPAISVFMLIQFPLSSLSDVMSSAIEAMTSARRLSHFFRAEELQDTVTRVDRSSLSTNDEVLSIKGGEFTWSKDKIGFVLEDINLSVRKGELVGVLGHIGSGKSSLLSAIIGDMRRTKGDVALSGSLSYASQNPWILSATIRDNILFSHEYDEVFYNQVIEACALRPDLVLLPHGDLTEVGEKGITLSGGQRARVALARAAYARADLALLDDVLAAVDAHVARHVFDHVIGPRGLLATKARILVMNNVAYLKYFNQLVYLHEGGILEHDSYLAIMANPRSEIRKLVRNYATGGSSSGVTTPSRTVTYNSILSEIETTTSKALCWQNYQSPPIASFPSMEEVAHSGLSEEHGEHGRVKPKVYLQYMQAASKIGFCCVVLATIFQQVASVLSTYMLRWWSEHNRELGRNLGLGDIYLLGYGLCNLVRIALNGTAALLIWVFCTLRSSKRLHDTMLDSVLHAPLSFFEVTPIGRVLNVFSRDVYVVDQLLARGIMSSLRTATTCASVILVITFSFPPFLLVVIPLIWFYLRVIDYYLATSRELKRLDAISRSPIFSWFSESLTGLSTIRAYNHQAIFIAKNALLLDLNNMCYLPSVFVNCWLAVRLEFIGSTIILSTALLAVAAVINNNIDAGLVGLVLSYALNTTSSLNWFVRSASEVERNAVSVERMIHYIEELPSEAPYEFPDRKPPCGWPIAGEVEFREYSTKYRPGLDFVVQDISLKIKPHEKVGICGRTGAGKSSLLLALFRIIEPDSGKILIDDIDITQIGLHDLRCSLSIVPQSPDLFEGTLRENIDPVGEHHDVDIWTSLQHARLKPYIESLSEGLDSSVQEAGISLSAGQRQLLCLARALLRKSRVLVLDEATSAVDLDTDHALQEIIRGPIFKEVTILTIAHRLNTIMDYDRVLVLDEGRVVEFDTPAKLLADRTSKFYSMASEAGLTHRRDVYR